MQIPENEIGAFLGSQLMVRYNDLTYHLIGIKGDRAIIQSEDRDWYPEIKNVKPLVRPMSSLPKPIVVEGKEFVPIVELAKMDSTYKDVDFEIDDDGDCAGMVGCGIMAIFTIEDEVGFMKEIPFNTFGSQTGDGDMCQSSLLPSQIRQQLIAWSFDIFGWLEKGLAEEMTDVKTELEK